MQHLVQSRLVQGRHLAEPSCAHPVRVSNDTAITTVDLRAEDRLTLAGEM